MGIDANALTKAHVRIRDARAVLKKQFDADDAVLKGKQDRLESEMLRILQDSKMESIRTESGTFYRQEDLVPSGADWDAFYRWVAANDSFEALERRIKKTFIKEYMDANEGALPPGVSVHRTYVVRIRRS